MKTVIELNEKDIKDILTRLYNVSVDDIVISYLKELKGYGLNESEITTIKVRIEK